MRQHHERMSFRGAVSAVTVLLLVYVTVPLLLVRFGCAAGIALVFVSRLGAAAWEQAAQTGAALLFAAAFLLTPYASYLWAPPNAPNPVGRALVLQGALCLVGALWFSGVVVFGRGFRVWRHRPAWPVAGLFLLLFLAVVLKPWLADLTYAGDEVFHADMIRMCSGLLRAIVTSREAWLALAGAVLAGLGVWFGLGRQRRQLRPYRPFLRGLIGANLLLVAAGAAVLAYPDSFLRDGYSRGLAFRFPAGEAWLSAVLLSTSVSPLPVAAEFFRFLACLSTALLGLFLLADRRWQALPLPVTVLAGCGLVLIPNICYHATLIYLELPAVLLFTVALADAERLVSLPWRRVGRLPAFWALLLVGFTKEVAAPGLMLLLGARGLWQLAQLWRRGEARSMAMRRLLAESALAGTLLLPVLLYLAVRYGQQIRPYAMRVDNCLHLRLWTRALSEFALQTGPLLLLAGVGARVAWRTGRRGFVAVNVLFGCGMFLFFFAEKPEYIGLARFNLLLLPPVFILGREGLLACVRHSRNLALVALLLLVLGNVLLAPLHLDGSRKPWGNTGERWYPFRECLLDVRDLAPHARILFGNMSLQYGVAFVLQELGWTADSASVDLADTGSEPEEIRRTLVYADKNGFDVLVYRSRLTELAPANAPLPPDWRFAQLYGDDHSLLLVFMKTAITHSSQPQLSPPPANRVF